MKPKFFSAAIIIGVSVIFLNSCKKEIKSNHSENVFDLPTTSLHASSTKIDLFKSLAQIFLQTVKHNVAFKQRAYLSSGAQPYDDYYIRIQDIIDYNQAHNYTFWNSSTQATVQSLVNRIKAEDTSQNSEPILFIPFLEDRNLDSLVNNATTTLPDAVIGFEYDDRSRECPAYTLDASEGLITSGYNIGEDYAWAHDVWVFLQEEDVPTGTGLAGDYTATQGDRYDGIPEYGGIIQVTDVGAIESWVQGKLELKYFVFDQRGTEIKEREFKKTKRKKLKNWVDYNDFIGYWNLNNIGNWMIEGWAELDGGSTNIPINQTFPPPCTGCPSTTVSYNIHHDDKDLGRSMVQFTDPYATVYSISYSNFKRKTR